MMWCLYRRQGMTLDSVLSFCVYTQVSGLASSDDKHFDLLNHPSRPTKNLGRL